MSQESFQLSDKAASIYEEQKVPAMFGPLADATLAVVPLREDDHVIDIACGTGIVARKARQKLGREARVVGVDLNEGMISQAGNVADANARACEWHVADATKLPFDDQSFTLAFCQQGIQFFPDQRAALSEMHRVLTSNGRVALTVWAGPSDFFMALADSLRKHINEEVAKQSLAPFSFGDITKLLRSMEATGFQEPKSQLLTIDRSIESRDSIAKEIMGNPVGPKVAELGSEGMATIVAEVAKAISPYGQGNGYIVPQTANLVQAYVA